jgi:hypothetical protein
MKPAIHVLVPNHAKRAPYADKTVCGIDLNESEALPAVWEDEARNKSGLAPDKWAPKGYRWCSRCTRNARSGKAE